MNKLKIQKRKREKHKEVKIEMLQENFLNMTQN